MSVFVTVSIKNASQRGLGSHRPPWYQSRVKGFLQISILIRYFIVLHTYESTPVVYLSCPLFQVAAQPPPVPIRPPAVPERSKKGPPPPITGVRVIPTERVAPPPPYIKQLPPPQVPQQQKPLQPPIPPPHIPHPPKPQQTVKNVISQVPTKQKPLQPKVLPTVPPQSHSLQQQSQVPASKQQQAGPRAIEQSQCHTNQPAGFQTQIQLTLNQSQIQQGLTQPQNQAKQPSQALKQNQTQQPSTKPQGQNTQLYNKQQNFPTPQPLPKTQEAQIQHQPVAMPPARVEQQPFNNKVSVRQDSNVSSDSFSQNSSPSYTTKTMETPLLPPHGVSSTNASQKVSSGSKKKMFSGDMGNGAPLTGNDVSSNGNAALTKSMSTPASLQTIVRFHHGSNMSLHHRVSMTDRSV